MSEAPIDLAPLTRAARWRPAEFAFWLVAAAACVFLPQHRLLLGQIAITGLFALSLDLILGLAGIVSLGHAAFFGIGAYTAGLLASHGLGDPLLGLAAACVAAGAAGGLASLLLLRGSDLTRLLVTIGVGLMLFEAANKATRWTGGIDGLQGIAMQPLLGRFRFDLAGTTACFYALAVLFGMFYLARRLLHSPFGTSLRGIRLNPLRMPALGVPVRRRLQAIYALGAAGAGAAGALLAQTTQFVSIDVFAFGRSAEILLILVLGGTGRLYGGLLGAILFVVGRDRLADLNPQFWQFWLGLLLMAVVLFARDGLLGGLARLARLARRVARRRRPGTTAA